MIVFLFPCPGVRYKRTSISCKSIIIGDFKSQSFSTSATHIRTKFSSHIVLFVITAKHQDSIAAPARCHANHHMALPAAHLRSETIVDKVILRQHPGGKDIASPHARPRPKHTLQLGHSWMSDVPGGNDVRRGIKQANEAWAAGIEIAVMVGNGDVDFACGLCHGRFDVHPRIAAVVRVAGKIAAGIITEEAVRHKKCHGALVLVRQRLGGQGAEIREKRAALVPGAGPHGAVGGERPDGECRVVLRAVQPDLAR